MRGPVWLEPPRGLVQLALAARSVTERRVVPGDGDVHEALEEVPLVRGGVAPLLLELLVRLEVGACVDQLEPPGQPHGSIIGAPPLLSGCYCRAVATILLVGVDLFFRGKLEGLLPGHRLVTTDTVSVPELVIADIARVEPEDVVEEWPDIPILGYTNHTDRAGLRRAHSAGFDRVLVKSALVERAADVIGELVGEP